jgi:subtilisin-like proprotein convertase family protein
MDAGLMTWYASGWTNVPSMSTCRSKVMTPTKTISALADEIFIVDSIDCQHADDPSNEVNYIEQVQVLITLTAQRRGDMKIYLRSPSNTTTNILPVRYK